MNLGLGLRLGQSGGRAKYTDIAIPALANAVRCWSIRRNIPTYKNGNAVRIIRTDGGSETDVKFSPNGLLSISGADAFVNALYEQNGNVGSALVQSTFANCPAIYQSNVLLKGLRVDNTDSLIMAVADTGLEAITNATAVADNGFSCSFWIKLSTTAGGYSLLQRRTASGLLYFLVASDKFGFFYKSSSFQNMGSADTNWNHIVLTAKGADGTANGLKGYRNGNTTPVLNATMPNVSTGSYLNLGIRSAPTGQNYEINDLIMFNKDLSAAEMLALYNAQAPYYGLGAK